MKDLENKLRKQSLQKEVYVDTDLLWDQVEPKLKKKRKRLIPFLLLFGILLGSGLLYKSTIIKSDIANIPATIPLSEAIINNEAKNIETTIENKNTNQIIANDQNYTKGNSIGINQNSTSDKINNKKIIASNDLLALKANSKIITKLDSKNSSINYSNLEVISAVHAIENETTPITIVQKTNSLINSNFIYIQSLYKNSINAFSLAAPTLDFSPSHYSNLVESKKSLAFFLSGGMSQSPINLQLSNSEFQNHFSNRINAESSLPSWHLRSGIAKELNNNLIIKAGLTFGKFYRNSKSEIINNETIILNDVVVEKIIGPNGTEDVLGSLTVQQTTTQIVERIHRVTSIDLNLSLLKQFQVSESLRFNIGPHISYNMLYSQSGNIHPTPNEEYDLTIDENKWFESNSGISIGVETEIQVPINNKTSFTAGILYDYKINGINSKTYGIKDKRNAIHIGLGIYQSF